MLRYRFAMWIALCAAGCGSSTEGVEQQHDDLSTEPVTPSPSNAAPAPETTGAAAEGRRPDLARIQGCQIVVTEKVLYYSNPRVHRESFDVLDEVAMIINSNPALGVVRIEVHTDSRGTDEYNRKLSEERALNVERYLVKRGVPAESLTAVGRGEEQPVSSEQTEEAWAKNRRTEFHIVDCSEEQQ